MYGYGVQVGVVWLNVNIQNTPSGNFARNMPFSGSPTSKASSPFSISQEEDSSSMFRCSKKITSVSA